MAQTPDGYLWLGTWLGLARFDGVRFKLFNRYNTPGLTDDSVNALAVTPDGVLHVGVREGLFRLRNGVATREALSGELRDAPIWDLALDSAGGLWCDSGKRAGPVPDGPFTALGALRIPHAAPSPHLLPLVGGGMAAIVKKGILRLPGTNQPMLESVPGLADPLEVHTAAEDGEGGWWFGKSPNLWHWNPARGLPARLEAASPDQVVGRVFRDAPGNLWVSLRYLGLHRAQGARLEPFHLMPRGPQPDATAFLEDRHGNLWVGTTQGLFLIRRRIVWAYTRADGLRDDNVLSMSEAPDGTIWTAGSLGWARLPSAKSRFEPSDDLVVGLRFIAVDSEGTVWTDQFRDLRLTALTAAGVERTNLMRFSQIQSLYVDPGDRLWVGEKAGVRCFLHGQEVRMTNLPRFEVRASYQTRDGAMWFGTWGKGAFRWQEGNLTAFGQGEGLADDRVFAFHEDEDGFLWIGTHNGVTRVHSANPRKDPFTFTVAHGLLDNLINHILEDDFGSLWFSCNRGIFRMERAGLGDVASGRVARAACDVYGAADGMPSSETNGEHQPAGCKARDGRLWFPTTGGVVVIDPKNVAHPEGPSTVVLEEVSIDGVAVDVPEPDATVELEPGRARVVRFRYSLPGCINAERSRFRHRLLGLDATWHEAGEERVAYFTNLKPEVYTFEVEAADAHGSVTRTPARFRFRLAPRFVETPWYPLCLASAGIALALGFVGWRLHWQRRASAVSEALLVEQERSRIAADLHDELGSRLTALSLRCAENGLATELRDTAERLRELIWAVDPNADTLDGLVGFLVDTAEHRVGGSGMALTLALPSPVPSLTLAASVRRQLALAVQEALANAVRHSGGQSILLGVNVADDWLHVVVEDDGRGGVVERTGGRGLLSMRTRMADLGGGLELGTGQSGGTRVHLWVPLASGERVPHG